MDIRRKGRFGVTLRFPETTEASTPAFDAGFTQTSEEVRADSVECRMEVSFNRMGAARIEGLQEAAGRTWGAHYIDIRRLG